MHACDGQGSTAKAGAGSLSPGWISDDLTGGLIGWIETGFGNEWEGEKGPESAICLVLQVEGASKRAKTSCEQIPIVGGKLALHKHASSLPHGIRVKHAGCPLKA